MELEDAIANFDQRLATWDDAQSAMELEITDPHKLEEDIEAADQFRAQVRCPRMKAAQMFAAMLAQTVPQSEPVHSVGDPADSVYGNIRLPCIELPKFSDVLKWQSFWE